MWPTKLIQILYVILISKASVHAFVTPLVPQNLPFDTDSFYNGNATSDELLLRFEPIESKRLTNSGNSLTVENSPDEVQLPGHWTANEIEPSAQASAEAPLVNPLDRAGQRLNNFVGSIVNGINRQTGNVNKTLGNLNQGIENGANGIQRFIANVLERKSQAFSSIVARIGQFFHSTLSRIRGIFEGLGNGFQLLVQTLFNRDRSQNLNLPKIEDLPPLEPPPLLELPPPTPTVPSHV